MRLESLKIVSAIDFSAISCSTTNPLCTQEGEPDYTFLGTLPTYKLRGHVSFEKGRSVGKCSKPSLYVAHFLPIPLPTNFIAYYQFPLTSFIYNYIKVEIWVPLSIKVQVKLRAATLSIRTTYE